MEPTLEVLLGKVLLAWIAGLALSLLCQLVAAGQPLLCAAAQSGRINRLARPRARVRNKLAPRCFLNYFSRPTNGHLLFYLMLLYCFGNFGRDCADSTAMGEHKSRRELIYAFTGSSQGCRSGGSALSRKSLERANFAPFWPFSLARSLARSLSSRPTTFARSTNFGRQQINFSLSSCKNDNNKTEKSLSPAAG